MKNQATTLDEHLAQEHRADELEALADGLVSAGPRRCPHCARGLFHGEPCVMCEMRALRRLTWLLTLGSIARPSYGIPVRYSA